MKKILILGCTIAGVKCAEELRNADGSSEIKLVSLDNKYPSDPEMYPSLVSGEIAANDVFYKGLEFYKKNKIEIVFNKKIVKINFKKNLLVTQEKEQLKYDVLVLSDLPEHKIPDIKGKTKTGIYGFKRLSDVENIIKQMPFFGEVCVESDSFMGLVMAVSFLKKEKDTSLIISGKGLFDWALGEELSVWVTEIFREKGLRVYAEEQISELLGDTDVKAVKLTSGKVLSTQAVAFDRTREDFRILSDSSLYNDRVVNVDASFKSNIDNVFVLSNICGNKNGFEPNDPDSPYYKKEVQEFQGAAAATGILNRDIPQNNLILINEFNFDDVSIDIIGNVVLDEEVCVRKLIDKDTGLLRVFYSREQKIVGAFLVNSGMDVNAIRLLIEQKADFSSVEEFITVSSCNGPDENIDVNNSIQGLNLASGPLNQSEPTSGDNLN